MKDFKIFVHGVPVGHEMCGYDTEDEKDYLKQFYDIKIDSASAMVIDIVEGVSYYTYLHKYVKEGDFTNCEGRPGSYFGITVSFGKETCDNVFMLNTILDSIYKQIIVGNVVKETKSGSSFMVRQLEKVTINNNNLLNLLRALLQKHISERIGDAFSNIESSITTKGKSKYSLSEVDSPAFREQVKMRQVIVSPEFQSGSKLILELEQKITPLETEKSRLKTENETLKEERKQLQAEVTRLTAEQAKAEGNIKKRLQDEKKQLQDSLNTVTAERDALQNTINEARKNIDLIDEPSKELMRLLASRFRKEDAHNNPKMPKNNNEDGKKNSYVLWTLVFNSVLLLGLLVISLLPLYHSFGNDSNDNIDGDQQEQVEGVEQGGSDDIDGVDVTEVADNDTQEETYSDDSYGISDYDNINDCWINIVNLKNGEELKKGESYQLAVMAGRGKAAKVASLPDGSWSSTQGIIINGKSFKIDDTFIVPDSEKPADGKYKVIIYYTVGKDKVSREISIKL